MSKFTFKTHHPTGMYRSFYPSHHYIKLKKKIVGMIGDKPPHRIRLQVIKDDINKDGNPNCTWEWITLKATSTNVDDAKAFLREETDVIIEKYNLFMEDKE